MTTSRTGTAKWKHTRDRVLQRDRHLTHCSLCRQHLDWTRSQTPASPEVDHIIPHIFGGTDTEDNLRVICKRCNASRGALAQRQKQSQKTAQRRQQTFTGTLSTSQRW